MANLFEIKRVLYSNLKQEWEIPDPELELVTERVIVMTKISGVSLGDSIAMGIDSESSSVVFRQMVEGLLRALLSTVFSMGTFMQEMSS